MFELGLFIASFFDVVFFAFCYVISVFLPFFGRFIRKNVDRITAAKTGGDWEWLICCTRIGGWGTYFLFSSGDWRGSGSLPSLDAIAQEFVLYRIVRLMGGSTVGRLSGMQKQVLSLYRGFLRAARSKSEQDRKKIESVVSTEFRRNSKEVDRKNFI